MKIHTVLGAGPPVLKLAGLAGGVGLYREEAEAVARSGHQVAMVDLAGDRWDDPAPGPLTWDLLAREVMLGLDGLGAGGAVLWGTSYGAMIALAAAARWPNRVAGLVLSLPPDPSHQPALWAAAFRWARRRNHPDLALRLTVLAGFGALLAWEAVWPTTLRRAPRLMRAALDARTPARTVRQKVDLLWSEDPGLPAPGTPTAIVAADWDPVAPLGAARRLQTRIPGASLHRVAWAGHAAPASRPRAYTRALLEATATVQSR